MFNVSYMALPLPLSLSVLLTNDHTVAISGGMSCTPRWVWGSYSTDCRLCHVIWRTMLPPCWHLQSKEQVSCINYQNILTWHFSFSDYYENHCDAVWFGTYMPIMQRNPLLPSSTLHWRWRQQVRQKLWYPLTNLQDVTHRKTASLKPPVSQPIYRHLQRVKWPGFKMMHFVSFVCCLMMLLTARIIQHCDKWMNEYGAEVEW
jgi:hypothetical protein